VGHPAAGEGGADVPEEYPVHIYFALGVEPGIELVIDNIALHDAYILGQQGVQSPFHGSGFDAHPDLEIGSQPRRVNTGIGATAAGD